MADPKHRSPAEERIITVLTAVVMSGLVLFLFGLVVLLLWALAGWLGLT